MPLCCGLPLERVQFDLLLAGVCRLGLQLVQVGGNLVLARLRGLRLRCQACQDLLGLGPDLAVEIGELGTQGAQARMVVQKRGRQVGNLVAQLNAPLAQPLDEVGRQHFRKRIQRTTALQGCANARGRRLRRRPAGAHTRKLARHLGKLLRGQDRIVLPDQQAGLRPVGRDLGLGVLHAFRQVGDLGRKPVGGGGVRFQLGVTLGCDIGIGNRVRDFGGEAWIVRGEFDDDDAGALDAIDRQLLAHHLEDALLDRNLVRVAHQSCDDEQMRRQGHPQRRIELPQLRQPELVGHLLQYIRRGNDLHLAGHALFVENRPVRVGTRIGTGENGFARLDQQARLGLVFRLDHPRERQRQAGHDQGNDKDSQPVPRDAGEELPQVDIEIGGRGRCCGHATASVSGCPHRKQLW